MSKEDEDEIIENDSIMKKAKKIKMNLIKMFW